MERICRAVTEASKLREKQQEWGFRLTWPGGESLFGSVIIPRSELNNMAASKVVLAVEVGVVSRRVAAENEGERSASSSSRGLERAVAHAETKLVLRSDVSRVPPTICLT